MPYRNRAPYVSLLQVRRAWETHYQRPAPEGRSSPDLLTDLERALGREAALKLAARQSNQLDGDVGPEEN
jgi:hypothetical protein